VYGSLITSRSYCALMTAAFPPVRREVYGIRNADCSQTVEAPANKDAIIVAVEWTPWRSAYIARNGIIPTESLKYFVIINCIHTTNHEVRMDNHLYTQKISNGHDITTLQMSSFYTSLWTQAIFMLPVNTGSKAISTPWLEPLSGLSLWDTICYLKGFKKNDTVILWKLFYWWFLKIHHWLWSRNCCFRTIQLQHTMCHVQQQLNMTHPTATTMCLWFHQALSFNS